jgi:hypothetical protein
MAQINELSSTERNLILHQAAYKHPHFLMEAPRGNQHRRRQSSGSNDGKVHAVILECYNCQKADPTKLSITGR